MLKILNNIINKIKDKDKDLEGMYVALDDLGYIIGFDKNLDKLQFYIGTYNEAKFLKAGIRLFKLDKLNIRKKIKEFL